MMNIYNPPAIGDDHGPNTVPHLMVDSVTIRNFRSFREITVEDCRRVNILVGENGSGKTALLEGLFLASGVNPELLMRTRQWRGFEGGRMSGTHEDMHRNLWGDVFHKFQTTKPALGLHPVPKTPS
jgi:predicted ATP-dependent endonuclease of OLD family